MPDKSTTSYALLDFERKFTRKISANWTSYIAKVCLGCSTYDVQLPDISRGALSSLFPPGWGSLSSLLGKNIKLWRGKGNIRAYGEEYNVEKGDAISSSL